MTEISIHDYIISYVTCTMLFFKTCMILLPLNCKTSKAKQFFVKHSI